MAGMGHMAKKPFIVAGLLGRSLRLVLEAVLIGLYGERALEAITGTLDNEILLAVVMIVSLGVAWLAWRWWSDLGPQAPAAGQ